MIRRLNKLDKSSTIIPAIAAFFTKFWTWFFYIGIGLMGKLGLLLQGQKKRSLWEILGTTISAGFVGYLATIWCMYKWPAPAGGYSFQGALIVPMATLLSDRVITFIVNVNWIPILEIIFVKKTKK